MAISLGILTQHFQVQTHMAPYHFLDAAFFWKSSSGENLDTIHGPWVYPNTLLFFHRETMDDLQYGWHGLAYFQTHIFQKEHAAERLNINTSGRSHEQQW